MCGSLYYVAFKINKISLFISTLQNNISIPLQFHSIKEDSILWVTGAQTKKSL